MDFWTVFAAVMSANLMTACVIYGLIEYSRHERQGTAGQRSSHAAALSIIVPMLFLALIFLDLFDKMPSWLERAFQ